MERNPFTKQGKALLCDVREIIVEKWLESSKPFEIAQRFNLPAWRRFLCFLHFSTLKWRFVTEDLDMVIEQTFRAHC